jgi:hypothetical protein
MSMHHFNDRNVIHCYRSKPLIATGSATIHVLPDLVLDNISGSTGSVMTSVMYVHGLNRALALLGCGAVVAAVLEGWVKLTEGANTTVSF